MTPAKRKPTPRRRTAMAQVHVVPYLKGVQWHIKVEGKRVSRFNRQRDAEDCAVFLARLMAPASVRFHDRRGRVKEERTFGRADDPRSSPG